MTSGTHSQSSLTIRWRVVVAAISVVATAPVWLPAYPAMVDLPQHAAQVALLKGLHDASFSFGHLYELNWFTPYLLGYALVYALSLATGIVVACKLTVALALCGVPILTAEILDALGADGRLALCCLPAMYGFAYQWGFLSLLVACPFGLWLLLLTVGYAENPTLRRGIALAVLSVALFFSHAIVWAMFLAISVAYVIASSKERRTLVVVVLPFLAALPVACVWFAKVAGRGSFHQPILWAVDPFASAEAYYHHIATWTSLGGFGWGRVTGLFARLVGLRSSMVVLIGAATLAVPILLGARPTHRAPAWIPLLVCTVTLFSAPASVGGIAFVYEHALPIFVPTYLIFMTRRVPARVPGSWFVLAAVLVAWFGSVLVVTQQYRHDADQFNQLLQAMSPGQRAMGLVFDRDTDVTIAPTFLHFPAWYASTKRGVVDPSFANTFVQPVLYRPEYLTHASDRNFEWRPQIFEWSTFQGSLYRYFLVRSKSDRTDELFRRATCVVSLKARSGLWWLYETDAGCLQPS